MAWRSKARLCPSALNRRLIKGESLMLGNNDAYGCIPILAQSTLFPLDP
jgi:hypothetical protein